jgi:hypothetical protein
MLAILRQSDVRIFSNGFKNWHVLFQILEVISMKKHVSILLSIILWLMTAILFAHIVPQHVSDPAMSFLFLFLAIGAVSCTVDAFLAENIY